MDSFAGKTILITGGTGSLGNALIPELLKRSPKEIRVFSRDEEKQFDMHSKYPSLRYIIGDVRDEIAVDVAMRGVDILYHAAALKIIPTCEAYPIESIRTNLEGTCNVKKSAIRNKVSKAVFISTDKAVQPINVYGACKMIAERVWVQQDINSNTVFCAVRYGNVIGSRGSVVPFFKKKIAEGKPIPITHDKMTRFLLTLDKAIQTIFYATEHMIGGEVFIPELPSCNIIDLPKVLSPNSRISIVGIRAGEKLHEVLLCKDESRKTIERNGYFIIQPSTEITLDEWEYTSENARILKLDELKSLLKESGEI